MMRLNVARPRLLAVFVCACVGLFAVAPARAIDPPPSVYPQPERIVVVANILGELNLFMKVLRTANLVDNMDTWIGGEAHLVVLGNFVGWGEDILPVINTIRSLEMQASEANGMVHTILGYGEINLLHRDVSNISPASYDHLSSKDSDEKIKQMTERGVQEMIERMPKERTHESSRREYENYAGRSLRPGAVEFLEMIAPGTELGDWLRSRNVVIRMGDFLFSSGGIDLYYSQIPLEEINRVERTELAKESLLLRGDAVITHPVRWRHLVTRAGGEMQSIIDATLYINDARAQIVGVTQKFRPTHQGFSARVFFVDSGMQAEQLGIVNRKLSFLDIVGNEFTLNIGKERFQTMTPPPPPPAPTAKNLRRFARD